MGASTGHGSTDLGRRIRERRRRAGLTREQAAEGAGMADSYLAYLEGDPDAAPTSAALARLAAALGTSSRALAGAGLELPPGQQQPDRRPLLERLTRQECRAYLGTGGVGRLVFSDARGPVALPVNYRMLGDDVVFRVGSQASLTGQALAGRVSFEVDQLDETLGEGWSVLVSGWAHLVTEPAERAAVERLGVAPWAGGARETYLRIRATEVTGRRIRAT